MLILIFNKAQVSVLHAWNHVKKRRSNKFVSNIFDTNLLYCKVNFSILKNTMRLKLILPAFNKKYWNLPFIYQLDETLLFEWFVFQIK